MIQRRETFVTTRAARLVLGITLAAGLGATVVASPVHSVPATPASKAPVAQAAFKPMFQPLGEGPAISVKKSFGRHDEDCVTVTQIKGADGQIYTTRGMICAE